MSYPPLNGLSASTSTAPSSAGHTPAAVVPSGFAPPPPAVVPPFGPSPSIGSSSGPFTSTPLAGISSHRPDYKGKRKASEVSGGRGGDGRDESPDAADDDDDGGIPGDGLEGDLEAAAAVLGGAAHAASNRDKEKKKVKVGARASIACKTCRKRKVRCSAEWPVCQFCTARKLECVYEGHPAENGGTIYAGPSGIHPGGNGIVLDAELPPTEMILEALDAFITNHFDTFPFIHRPSLTQEIKEGHAPKEVICCTLALAARFSQSLRSLHPASPTAASEHYAGLASQLLLLPEAAPGLSPHGPSADTPISLMRCQCHLMLGFYELTAGRDNSGWLKIGTAIRMAQTLRLGFDDEVPVYETARNPTSLRSGGAGAGSSSASTSISSEPRDIIRAEMRRRTFWALFCLDRTVSDGNERPCGLKVPRIASLRMPGPDADFAAGRKSVGAKFDPDPPAWSISVRATSGPAAAAHANANDGASSPRTQAPLPHAPYTVDPAEEPDADLYGYTLRIAEIWSKVASYIGSGGRNVDRRAPWLSESTFAQLAGELADFEAKLPDVLKYSKQTLIAHCLVPEEAKLFALLHLTNAMARHVLHRDYLPFLPPNDFKAAHGPIDGEPLFGSVDEPTGWWQESFDMAAKSANIISDVCSHLASHGIVLTHPFAGFAAVAAGTVHSHIRYWPQSSSVPIDAAHYLAQDAEILNGLRQIYPIAARWYESLAGLQLLYFNLARGVLDSDPFKVRARVLQLLRSAKDDAEVGPPVRDGTGPAPQGVKGGVRGTTAKTGTSTGSTATHNGHATTTGGGGAKRARSGSAKVGMAAAGGAAKGGERGKPAGPKREDSSSSVVLPSLSYAGPPSPDHAHALTHSLNGLVSPLDTPLGSGSNGNGATPSTATTNGAEAGGPFAPLYAGAATPTSALFPSHHPLTLDHGHSHGHGHGHAPSADPSPLAVDLGLLPVPGDFSFDLSSTGGLLGGLGGLGALSTLDEWGAGYYFGGSNWGLGGFGGLGVAPGVFGGGSGPHHGGAPFGGAGAGTTGADLGWGSL